MRYCLLFSPAPPSYETCLFGRVNIREDDDTDFTRGAMEFAPMYAFYDWERNKVQNSCQKQDKDDTNFVWYFSFLFFVNPGKLLSALVTGGMQYPDGVIIPRLQHSWMRRE